MASINDGEKIGQKFVSARAKLESWRELFLGENYEELTENFFGILISTRLCSDMLKIEFATESEQKKVPSSYRL